MTNQFDALNNLMNVDEGAIKKQIQQYFKKMDLPEEKKEKRIALAEELEQAFRTVLLLILGAEVLEENPKAKLDYYTKFIFQRYINCLIDAGLSTDSTYQAIGFLERYAKKRCQEVVETALDNISDKYIYSTDHSESIAVDEANAVYNCSEYQLAIAQGYTQKTWVTFHDNKVRHNHRLVDGLTIDIDQPFNVGTSQMLFPMDTSLGANMKEIYRCRCVCEYSGQVLDNIEDDEE